MRSASIRAAACAAAVFMLVAHTLPMSAALARTAGEAAVSSPNTPPAQMPLPPPSPSAEGSAVEVQMPPGGAAALTQADVESWLDGFMPYALQRGDIAGAVVVVVKDGQVLAQRGYGFADVDKRLPVDPAVTLFRPGSVSKLFTWTAVMQLVEQGKVDLDVDVNTYIDFTIPERYGQPITMRNIMTHTPGFEEQIKGLMGTGDETPDLGAHLKRWVPERIFPPGTTPAYSNYATALAGYVVERVSGVSFDDYVDRNIFEPLGMEYSTFRQPLPERLKPYMSNGYAVALLPPKPFEIVGPAPAGSLSASGADMARFMIAHLQNGRYGDQRILAEETAQQMHGTALTMLPRLNRMLLGFYESNYNGRRVIAHGGDTQWFHSNLLLFIDDGVGLYVSMNSAGHAGATSALRSTLFQEFADRYLPGPTLDGEVDEQTAAEHARMIAGSYGNSRRVESNFMSLINLTGTVKVIDNQDGTISVSMVTSAAGVPIKWREIEPFVWRQVGGEQLLAAEVKDGKVVRFSFGEVSPFMMFEPMPAVKAASWLMPVFVVALGALLLASLAWPISALTRRHYRAQYALAGQDARAHRWVRIATSAAIVLWIGWLATIAMMFSNFSLLSGSLDGLLRILQILSLVVFFGGAGIGVWNAAVVVRSGRSWYAKTWAVVLALALLASLWVALAYHMISFSVNY